MVGLIWATRGRSWGFRFLLDGEESTPLITYESAFLGTDAETKLCRRANDRLALRFLDPFNRADASGRIIPHDFVVPHPTSSRINSVDDGLREIWPLVADIYDRVWDAEKPPSIAEVRSAIAVTDQD